jgi:hypothetical protein
VKFYSGQYTPDELALIAASLDGLSVDDEVWLQRVLNLRLLRLNTQLEPAAAAEAADPPADAEPGDEAAPPAQTAVSQLVHVTTALTAGAGRLAQLLRDRRVLSAEALDVLQHGLAAALDALGADHGVNL